MKTTIANNVTTTTFTPVKDHDGNDVVGQLKVMKDGTWALEAKEASMTGEDVLIATGYAPAPLEMVARWKLQSVDRRNDTWLYGKLPN